MPEKIKYDLCVLREESKSLSFIHPEKAAQRQEAAPFGGKAHLAEWVLEAYLTSSARDLPESQLP